MIQIMSSVFLLQFYEDIVPVLAQQTKESADTKQMHNSGGSVKECVDVTAALTLYIFLIVFTSSTSIGNNEPVWGNLFHY